MIHIRILVFFLFLFNFSIGFSQSVILGDSLSIELLKVKEVSKTFNLRSGISTKSAELTKILTRCKVVALNKEDVDPNAFSLLDTVNKLRYRLTEFIGYKAFSIGGSGYSSKMLLKTNLLNDKNKRYPNLYATYEPDIRDIFDDFHFEGYETIEIPVNFHSNKNNVCSVVYFAPTRLNKFTAELFFNIINLHEKPFLKLYYGERFVADIVLDAE